jgi:hypothetical protein
MSNSEQPVLIITGMHRSGTSLAASLLQSAGLDIGQKLLDGDSGNPKGYFENIDFMRFHESVLYSLGIDRIGWTLEENISPPEYFVDIANVLIRDNASFTHSWGWKEPRTTLFLNFWGDLLKEAKFLFVYRAPWEVIDSLYRRGDDIFHHHPELAPKVWMSYNKKILDFYRSCPDRCLLTNINSIISDPASLTETIKEKFGISLATPDSGLYDCTSLKRQVSQSQRPGIVQRHFPEVFALYCELNSTAGIADNVVPELERLASPTAWILQDWLDLRRLERESQIKQEQCQTQLGQAQSELGEGRTRLETTQTQLGQTQSELGESCARLTATQKQLRQSQEKILAMENSRFWKLRTMWLRLWSFVDR